MLRKVISFVLHCRLEDVMAAGFSLTLALIVLSRQAYHTFPVNDHDVAFIMLPAGILAVKCLLGILFAPDEEKESGTRKFLNDFFRPLLEIFRDWFPFFVLSACYYALFTNLMLRVNPHLADALLARIDGALLGGHQPSLLLEPWISPLATDFFCLIYFSYVLALPGIGLYFYLKKEKIIFRRVMMGYLTLMLLGITSYLLVPARGPATILAGQYTRDLKGDPILQGMDHIMRVGHVDTDCFPSLHVGITFLVSLYLFCYRRRLFLPSLVYVALMCGATLYLRYHYLVDVLAAFVYAPAAIWLNDFLLAHWPGERILAAATVANANNRNLPTDVEPA